MVLALASGCQSPGRPAGAAPENQMAQVQGSAQEILAGILKQAGLETTDLVLETIIAFPPPAGGDQGTKVEWKGRFAGLDKVLINADDRVLVVVKTSPCNAVEMRYVFNPFIRTWMLSADRSSPEGNLLWVLFNGKASDFMKEVAEVRNSSGLLGSLVRDTPPVVGATFPVLATNAGMRSDVLSLGLGALDEHLRTVHADGQPCKPDVHVYIKPAAASRP
jgi:hypothetical protein